jgi:hypothetical protein
LQQAGLKNVDADIRLDLLKRMGHHARTRYQCGIRTGPIGGAEGARPGWVILKQSPFYTAINRGHQAMAIVQQLVAALAGFTFIFLTTWPIFQPHLDISVVFGLLAGLVAADAVAAWQRWRGKGGEKTGAVSDE